ncbi:MAG: Coenzyme F420 hydrogenase/dehydrogenase, beta subunit C-terminal domain, partial [Bdellovibrionales bacterium]|nr:Coenzyme F420 hydrogenase/dehydrogenase, beta subunit C-terminal domain [Bdellovibrionales bacterium]
MKTLPLRKSGPLVEPFRWPIVSDQDPPRALKTLGQIIDNDLCHRCGSCVGICPTNVLGLDDEEFPVVENLGACTDCDLCVKVCPGDEFDAVGVARQLFHTTPDIRDMHGHFEHAYLSYATDPEIRQRSTSGGLVTGLLVSLLQRGEIDGAVVIASDPVDLWKGIPVIARTEEEIRKATKAKYAIAPTNRVFREIREVAGRYALVGLPCQIHGFHKAARLDKRLRERVAVTIGLFCHAAVEHEPMRYIWNHIGEPRHRATAFISRFGKHSGTPHIEFEDGSTRPVYFPEKKGFRPSSMEIINVLYRLYTPPRCLTCYDSTSEFADIAVGDPWMPTPSDDISFYDGYTFVFARTHRGDETLSRAKEAGDIDLIELRDSTARRANTAMGIEK